MLLYVTRGERERKKRKEKKRGEKGCLLSLNYFFFLISVAVY